MIFVPGLWISFFAVIVIVVEIYMDHRRKKKIEMIEKEQSSIKLKLNDSELEVKRLKIINDEKERHIQNLLGTLKSINNDVKEMRKGM